MGLLTLISIVSMTNAFELNAVSNAIEFSLKIESMVSRNGAETSETVDAQELINVRVDEHVAVRAGSIKLSFTPLSADVDLSAVVGTNIPTAYLNRMSLFQAFYLNDGLAERECKVLVLDKQLDELHQNKLRDFLSSKNIIVDEQGEYFMFDCAFKTLSNS